MESSPKELEPYVRAHQKKVEEQDYWQFLWWREYGLAAVFCAVDYSLKGRESKVRYVEKPIYSLINKPELTEEEKQREVDKFFAQEEARRINWRRNHKRNQSR